MANNRKEAQYLDCLFCEENKLLSFCIPTYNHAQPLKKCLEAMIPQAKKFNVPIYISDNASTDNTIVIVENFKKTYPFLYYRSNNKNLGVDQNMVDAVRMATTKYVWAFGSRRVLLPGVLEKIYNSLFESNWDLMVLNDLYSLNLYEAPKSKEYNSAQKVFRELSRNLTGLGFQILPLEAWKQDIVEKYDDTEWTVYGVALEFIAIKEKPRVYFISEPSATDSGQSHWSPRCFQIWSNWKKVMTMLPSVYSESDKEFIIKNSVNYFFGPKFNLTDLRSKRIYNVALYNKYKADFIRYGGVSTRTAYLIAKSPVSMLKMYKEIYSKLRRLARVFIHTRNAINPRFRQKKIGYT